MEVRLPRLGEGADSGTVASIFVKEGDRIKKDQPILELESEKAVASIPSTVEGTITKIHVKEGDEIKVGQVLLSVGEDGAPGRTPGKAAVQETPAQPVKKPVERETPAPVQLPAALPEGQTRVPPPSGIPVPASPSIRKMAGDLGIDLTRVAGSERGGRIVLTDLRRYIQQLQQVAFSKGVTTTPAMKTPAESVDFAKWGPVTKKKISTLRKTIAGKMVESWTSIPHVTQFDEADISDVLALRKKHVDEYAKLGAELTLTPFILKTLAAMLKKHPAFNASLDEATGEIVYKNYCHLGIAVDTDQGLIVPVIRNVDKKSLLELSRELKDLATRTRERKVSLEEMQGATFTVSNQGGIGGAHFTPIVNPPQVAILGIGRGGLKPVVRGGKVEVRTMLPLGLSYDHRVIDGADAARFIAEFVQAVGKFTDGDVRAAVKSGKKVKRGYKAVKKGKK